MPKNSTANIDLTQLFGAVAKSMLDQRDSLNRADTYNHDHGNNMVDIFEAITNAIQEKQTADPADQLAHASQYLRGRKSGSAQVYADGLAQAAEQFQGQPVTNQNVGLLIQSLLGGGQVSQVAPQGTSGNDMVGDILNSLVGSQSRKPSNQDGLDIGDLLNAGVAFMNAKQKGNSTAEAAISALISASPLGQSSHRAQSGTVVANTIMQVLGALSKK